MQWKHVKDHYRTLEWRAELDRIMNGLVALTPELEIFKNGSRSLRFWFGEVKKIQIDGSSLDAHGASYPSVKNWSYRKENREKLAQAGIRIMRKYKNRYNQDLFALFGELCKRDLAGINSLPKFFDRFKDEKVGGRCLADFGVTTQKMRQWCSYKPNKAWPKLRELVIGKGVVQPKKVKKNKALKLVKAICKIAPYQLGNLMGFYDQIKNIKINGICLKTLNVTRQDFRNWTKRGSNYFPEFDVFAREKGIAGDNHANLKNQGEWIGIVAKLQEAFIVAVTKAGYRGPAKIEAWLDWANGEGEGRSVFGITAKDLGIGKPVANKIIGKSSLFRKARQLFRAAARDKERAEQPVDTRDFELCLAACLRYIVEHKGWECEKTNNNLCKTAAGQLKEIGLDKKKLLGLVSLSSREGYSEIIFSAMAEIGFALSPKAGQANRRIPRITEGNVGEFEQITLDLLVSQAKKWCGMPKGDKTLDDFFVFNMPTFILKMRIRNKDTFLKLVVESETLRKAFKKTGFLDEKYSPIRRDNPVAKKSGASIDSGNEAKKMTKKRTIETYIEKKLRSMRQR